MKKARIAEIFFLLTLTSGAFCIYLLIQPAATYSGCRLCDAHHYLAMYNFFEGLAPEMKAGFPYYSRAFVPYLASLFPGNDAFLGFQMVNLIFSLVAVVSIYLLWKKLGLPLYCIAIGLFWLLFHWTGIIRLNAMDPITVDVPTYSIQTLFIFIVLNRKFVFLLLLCPLAVLQRESIMVLQLVLLAFALFHNYYFKEEDKYPVWIIFSSLVVSILVKFVYTIYFPPDEVGKSSVRLVLFYIKEVILDPFKIVRWMVGICMAYGAFLLLAIQQRKSVKLETPFMLFLLIISGTYLLLGIIAGGDSTRIVFLGFPFVMTWILLQFKELSWILVVIALLMSTILMKLEKIIPDPGREFLSFAQWYPEFSDERLVWGWAIYFAGCFLILYIINKFLPTK